MLMEHRFSLDALDGFVRCEVGEGANVRFPILYTRGIILSAWPNVATITANANVIKANEAWVVLRARLAHPRTRLAADAGELGGNYFRNRLVSRYCHRDLFLHRFDNYLMRYLLIL